MARPQDPERAAPRCRSSGRTRSLPRACAGGWPPTSTVVSRSPATHMRVGDHLVRARHPARALDRQAAGGAEHAHDAARGRAHARGPADLGQRRRHVGRGAGQLRQRIEARERVQDRPRGRQQLVELAQDDRALDVRAQLPAARRLRRPRRRRSRRFPSRAPRPRAAPSRPSSRPRPGTISVRRRSLNPRPSSPVARIAPASSAPIKPNAGAYGEADPRGSRRGPRRVPRNAPTAKPANDSTPTMNPRRKPNPASSAANATMSQSSVVTRTPADRGHCSCPQTGSPTMFYRSATWTLAAGIDRERDVRRRALERRGRAGSESPPRP